jgi:hypothetical protein
MEMEGKMKNRKNIRAGGPGSGPHANIDNLPPPPPVNMTPEEKAKKRKEMAEFGEQLANDLVKTLNENVLKGKVVS